MRCKITAAQRTQEKDFNTTLNKVHYLTIQFVPVSSAGRRTTRRVLGSTWSARARPASSIIPSLVDNLSLCGLYCDISSSERIIPSVRRGEK